MATRSWGAPGLTTSNKKLITRSKERAWLLGARMLLGALLAILLVARSQLLGAKGMATRSWGAPGLTTSNKKLITRSKGHGY